MAKKIRWTSQAKLDRYDILKFFKETGAPQKTLINTDSAIRNIIKHLSRFPSLGKIFGDNDERVIYKGNYSIIYKVVDDEINILQVWDSRKNPEDLKL